MEDVVLHHRPGPSDGLSSLLERTEKLLEPFPCRTAPIFTPWYPAATVHCQLPIRPAKPAPVITFSDVCCSKLTTATNSHPLNSPHKENAAQNPSEDKDVISETPNLRHLLPVTEISTLEQQPQKDQDRFLVSDSLVRRSWSVSAQRGQVLQSFPSMSKHFHHTVSIHRLHLRQRAKWVISQHNCGLTRDLEQVWRTLSRSVQSSGLPTCNANIRRERAEIWVFCDVVQSEQVGRHLKEALQLSGKISLSVRRLGNIFSL